MSDQSYQEMGLNPPMTAGNIVRFVLLMLFFSMTVTAVRLMLDEHPPPPDPPRPFTIRTMIA